MGPAQVQRLRRYIHFGVTSHPAAEWAPRASRFDGAQLYGPMPIDWFPLWLSLRVAALAVGSALGTGSRRDAVQLPTGSTADWQRPGFTTNAGH